MTKEAGSKDKRLPMIGGRRMDGASPIEFLHSGDEAETIENSRTMLAPGALWRATKSLRLGSWWWTSFTKLEVEAKVNLALAIIDPLWCFELMIRSGSRR